MRLDGKIAIVTGGSAGIGAGIVKEFLDNGASVAIAARFQSLSAQEAMEEYRNNDRVLLLQADTKNTADVNDMVARTVEHFGKLDILVNNAGYADGGNVETQTEDQWDNMLATNLSGYARCVRAALPHLKASRGTILNVASLVGVIGQRNAFAYCATKGGIIGMTKNLAIDLAKYGIRVNVLLPAWIASESLIHDWPNHQENPATAYEELVAMHPLGRVGTPEDCGSAAAFLCSDKASFLTGVALELDGGISLGYGKF